MKMLVLLIVIAGFVWWLGQQQARRAQVRASRRNGPLPAPQTMVACAHCGLRVPRAEAVSHDGNWYCSADHARLGARAQPRGASRG